MRTHDGLELHVTACGPTSSPGGSSVVTVLLAHCWTADEEDWHLQVRDLLLRYGHEIRLVTWDHRGHGRSDAAAEDACTIENLARDLGDVVDRYAADGPLVIAGHSIGGMTMTAIPEVRPDLVPRIAGLLFCSTSSGDLGSVTLGLPEGGKVVRAQIPRMLAMRARLMSRSQRKRAPIIERHVVARFLFGNPRRPRDIGLVVDQIINCPPATMSGFYNDFMQHERTAGLAVFDDVPTTVLVGTHDLLTPRRHGRRIAGAIRGARLVLAPDAGHMLPLERPDLVTTELCELVESARATSATPSLVE